MPDAQTDWITVAQAAKLSGYAISTIQWLLRTGKIKGIKPGHDWLTTLEAVMEFKNQAKKGRPSRMGSRA